MDKSMCKADQVSPKQVCDCDYRLDFRSGWIEVNQLRMIHLTHPIRPIRLNELSDVRFYHQYVWNGQNVDICQSEIRHYWNRNRLHIR